MKLGEYSYTADKRDIGQLTVGRYCQIATDVKIFDRYDHPCTANHNLVANFPFSEMFHIDYPSCYHRGDGVFIENDVWIGTGAILFSGITIGNGAIVGAFSVVTKDVPPFAVVVGNPAKIVRYRFNTGIRNKLLKIKWWNWDKEKVTSNINDMLDVKSFVKKYG